MKEAFEVMAEHWAVTLWIGIVIMVSLNRIHINDKQD
jgi:hypothetical protein